MISDHGEPFIWQSCLVVNEHLIHVLIVPIGESEVGHSAASRVTPILILIVLQVGICLLSASEQYNAGRILVLASRRGLSGVCLVDALII